MKCLYDRKDVRGWHDLHLRDIHGIHERWRADGTLAKQIGSNGRTARSFALVVRQERRKRGLGT
jgi:hypothetical protein